MNIELFNKCKVLNEYRIIEWILSYWMNIELTNKCKAIEWT